MDIPNGLFRSINLKTSLKINKEKNIFVFLDQLQSGKLHFVTNYLGLNMKQDSATQQKKQHWFIKLNKKSIGMQEESAQIGINIQIRILIFLKMWIKFFYCSMERFRRSSIWQLYWRNLRNKLFLFELSVMNGKKE